MLVKGQKYPVVADITRLMLDAGFRYRDRIVWVKPKGYVRISRRRGVVIQHPYPMYYYPDNIQESILIFQKGRFDYSHLQELDPKSLSESKISIDDYHNQEWYLTVWKITNVLPLRKKLEKGIAAFPEEIPKRLIKLFSFFGETVLDPFLGSGTTMKVAQELGRSSWGYEIDLELKKTIKEKFDVNHPRTSRLFLIERRDAKKLRSSLQSKVINFFFQAEDGIRDLTVTGVQTCALPICPPDKPRCRAGNEGVQRGDRGAHGSQGPAQRPGQRQQQGKARRIAEVQRRAGEVDGPISVALGDGLPQGDIDSIVVERADRERPGQAKQQVRYNDHQADHRGFDDGLS